MRSVHHHHAFIRITDKCGVEHRFPMIVGTGLDIEPGGDRTGARKCDAGCILLRDDVSCSLCPHSPSHIGRNSLTAQSQYAVWIDFANTPRSNRNPVNNFMQAKEDPITPGLSFGTDGFRTGSHSGGQILSLTAGSTLDPDQSVVTYVTDRSTASITFEGDTPNPNHSGFYRKPVMPAVGALIAAHSSDSHADKNLGSRSYPALRYAYRWKTLKKVGASWVPDATPTTGISKGVAYRDTDTLVHYSGTLWDLDPVEVCARTKPSRGERALPSVEHDVFVEEGISQTVFRGYLREKDLAVSRDAPRRCRQAAAVLSVHRRNHEAVGECDREDLRCLASATVSGRLRAGARADDAERNARPGPPHSPGADAPAGRNEPDVEQGAPREREAGDRRLAGRVRSRASGDDLAVDEPGRNARGA